MKGGENYEVSFEVPATIRPSGVPADRNFFASGESPGWWSYDRQRGYPAVTCYHPLSAWKSLCQETAGGKASISFSPPSGPSEPVLLACGQCVGCRVARSREWAVRCVHEASLHEANAFVTLTYDDSHIPDNGSLVKKDHQDWMKRLRERLAGTRIRYFLAGEYGGDLGRPHYHALLFGVSFSDQVIWSKSGRYPLWRSRVLEETWPFGHSWIGEVSWESAAYVARYCLKKVNGDRAYERYAKDVDPETGELRMLEPEYVAMSRRPGVGRDWFDHFRHDVDKGYLTINGRRCSVPRRYDAWLEGVDLEAWAKRRLAKREYAVEHKEPRERLAVLEEAESLKQTGLKRSLT